MPTIPSKVQPGDLISSEFMNQLIDVCGDLQQRIVALEKPTAVTSGVTITALLPSGEKRIGDAIYLVGSGFDAPQGNIVTIDGIGVTATAGGDRDRELIAVIPNIQGVTATGKTVTVLVSNTRGTDMHDFVVFPATETVPEGQIFVNLSDAPADAQLLADHSYTFTYTVQAITNLDETYALAATVSTGWTAQIVDAGGAPLSPAEIALVSAPPPAGATQTVRVKVSIPAGTATGTTGVLRLAVSSKRNVKLVGRSGGDSITVGSAPPAEVTIPIVLGNVVRTSNSQPSATTSGGVVKIGAGVGVYRITFNAQIKAGTVYAMQLTPPADNRWSMSFTGSGSAVTAQNIGPVASDTNQPILVFVSAAAGAPAGEVALSLSGVTDPTQHGQIGQPIALIS